MTLIELILIIIGLVLLFLAAIGIPAQRFSLLAAGLFFVILGFAIPVFAGA